MKYASASVLLLVALAFGQTWVVGQVDSTAASGSPVELVKAADGRLWTGYQTRDGAARVACLGESGWSFTDLCSLARLPSTHFRPFFAASPHGELCLACWDSLADTNRLYRMVNDTWRSEPNPYSDSHPRNTIAYDSSGRLYTLYDSYFAGATYGMGHESDSGWTSSSVVRFPCYPFYPIAPAGCLTADRDGNPWFFGFGGWEDGTKGDFATDLLYLTGDTWTSVWRVEQYNPGNFTPIPIALVPHGEGVGSLTWRGYIRYDTSETVTVVVSDADHPPVAGLAYTRDDVPIVVLVGGLWNPLRLPLFAFKTNRWHVESIPGPESHGGVDIETDTLDRVVIVYSTRDSGLWCATGTDVVGAKESPSAEVQTPNGGPTILSAASGVKRLASCVVFDAMGRRVAKAKPGVYFVRQASSVKRGASSVTKVVVQH